MLGAIKNIINLVNIEAANLSGANVNGYKKKSGSLGSSGDGLDSIGNDIYTKTDYSQGQIQSSSDKTDLAIQGDGFFVLLDESALASFNPNKSISQLNSEKSFVPPINSGTFSVNGNTVNVDATTDTFQDVLDKIGTATGGVVTASYDTVQNSVTLTNNSAVAGSQVTVSSGTSNFLKVAQLDQSATQPGPFNLNYITSNAPVGSSSSESKLYLTRKGDFSFNADGFLVNSKGMYVAGVEEGTGRLIKIDKKTFDGAGDADDVVNFSPNGTLFNETQGTKAGKQLALAKVPNPQSLASSNKGSELYVLSSATGNVTIGAPADDGLGSLRDQSIEASNSSTVDSLTNLSILQKALPSTLSALKATFSMQDDLNNSIK